MKIYKRIVSLLIAISMLTAMMPNVFAAEDNIYTIKNDYIQYSINAETGGFSVETLDGNPQKELDNDIPLLYKEDSSRSNGTSFTTIRINGKDYVFGRSYGFFGTNTTLHTPVISEGGRLITIDWDILNYTVTQKVALSAEKDTDLTGNVGISYSITNKGNEAGTVGVRVLLDTALDSTVDSPYLIKDTDSIPMKTEVEFEGEDLPSQIRGVDSLTNPSKMLYTFLKGWNTETSVDRVIVGHWRNLANTRYEYTPDEYCDFTNYSNKYRFPDSAIAYYWNEENLEKGKTKNAEILYGVGNFSAEVTPNNLGIDMSIDNKIRLNDKQNGYADDGKFEVTVVVDNSVDDAKVIEDARINIAFEEGISMQDGEESYVTIDELEVGDVLSLKFKLQAEPQKVISSKTIAVNVSGTQNIDESTAQAVSYSTSRNILTPAVKGALPDIQITNVMPKTVYTGGDKTITIGGKIEALKALKASERWELALVHTKSDHRVVIPKSSIAFVNEGTAITFTTNEELSVGEYTVEFTFDDTQLVDGFGVTSVTSSENLNVSNDPIYKCKSYGMILLVRYNKTDYDFVPISNEEEYMQFIKGEIGGIGLTGTQIPKFNYNDSDDTGYNEILITVKGPIKEATDDDGNTYYQALTSDGDVTINNVLQYTGDEPLIIEKNGGVYSVFGDGKIGVINGLDIWSSKWSFKVNKGTLYSLDPDDWEQGASTANDIELTLEGAGCMVQAIAGFLIDIKYGVLTKAEDSIGERNLSYGVSFGGKMSLPIKIPGKDGDDNTAQNNNTQNGKVDAAENTVKKDTSGNLKDALSNMSGSESSSGGVSSGASSSKTTNSIMPADAATRAELDKFTADTNLDDSLISVEIEDVLFGEREDDDVGFIGINFNTTFSMSRDTFGSLITNAPGIYASLTINTIENFYAADLGVSLSKIECEVSLAFKETEIKSVDKVVPDSLHFYVREGLQIPIVAGVLYITGLGGGIDDFADTIGGNFEKLPPINLSLFARLKAIEKLVADLNATVNLSGISLDGTFYINILKKKSTTTDSGTTGNAGNTNSGSSGNTSSGTTGNSGNANSGTSGNGSNTNSSNITTSQNSASNSLLSDMSQKIKDMVNSPLEIEAGVSAKWIDPICFKMYGNITVIDGLLTGGITVTITDSSFLGYAYLSLCIPNSIPFVGGNEIAGVEAAVSDEYIGANLKILGIKIGFIYYWDGDFSAGEGISLSSIDGALGTVDYEEQSAHAVFGTNMKKLKRASLNGVSLFDTSSVSFNFAVADEDSFIFEIPFEADDIPTVDDIEIKTPNGQTIPLVPEDNNGNGNFLVQCREDGNYMYISVTDEQYKQNGVWSVSSLNEKLKIEEFDMYGIDNIPELTGVSISHANKNSHDAEISWTTDSESDSFGYVDIYISKDKDILTKLRKDKTDQTDIYNLARVELDKIKSGKTTVTMPDSYESGKYYVAAMLSSDFGGMSTVLSSQPFEFENENLPNAVKGASINYAGDGEIYVEIDDNENVDYTHYLVSIVAADGSSMESNSDIFSTDETVILGKGLNLAEGAEYYVEVKTLKKVDDAFYYGTDVVKTNKLKMPKIDKPVLLSAETNVSGEYTSDSNFKITYKFDRPVWLYCTVNQADITEMEFKDVWEIETNLADGEYIVDFTAYGLNKDSVTGADFEDSISNARMGFKVDTKLPVLSLSSQKIETQQDDVSARFGTNVVFAKEDGTFVVNGMTETSAVLTVNTDKNEIKVENDGTFAYTGKLEENETVKTLEFSAVDKAGNESKLIVYVVANKDLSIDHIKILNDGKEIEKNSDNEAVINLKKGEKANLSVIAVSTDGSETVVSEPNWDVLYEKNLISFENGVVTAVSNGECAVKAGVATGTVTLSATDELFDMAVEDYVLINISLYDKTDLANAIKEAEKNIANAKNTDNDVIEEYRKAIDDAKSVYADESASENKISDAVSDLIEATKKFDLLKGTSEDGDKENTKHNGGGSSTTKHTVTIENTQGGTVKASSDKVKHNASLTLTITPDEGYEVGDVLINGVSYGKDKIVTISSVKENINVNVTFIPKSSISDSLFDDVTETDWFYEDVVWAYAKELIYGTSEKMFSPNLEITRGMLVTILYRLDGEEDIETYSGFDDVPNDSYYAKAVAWAKNCNIVSGYNDNEFGPEDLVTREQIASILYRYANSNGFDMTQTSNISMYNDVDSISDYAVEAIKWSVGVGIITGRTDEILAPKDNATRAETVAMLKRFYEKYSISDVDF